MALMMDETNTMQLGTEGASGSVEAVTRSPRTHIDSTPLPTDSMVTVPLSEADSTPDEEGERDSMSRPRIVVEGRRDSSRPSSSEILKAFGRRSSEASIESAASDSPTVSVHDVDAEERRGRRSPRRGSDGSGKSEPVDWAELERKEEQEPGGEGQDKVGATLQHSKTNNC
jgi:hypothetical protein